MKILALEKESEGAAREDFFPHLKNEALKVWQLYNEEVIREIYFDGDKNTAVIVMECKDKTEAEKILDELPLVKEKLITFEIIPLMPYSGFARLFSK